MVDIEFKLKEGKFKEDEKILDNKLLPKNYRQYRIELFSHTSENGIVIFFTKFKFYLRDQYTFGFDFDKSYIKEDLQKILHKNLYKYTDGIYDILYKLDNLNRNYSYNLEKDTICYPIIPFNSIISSKESFFICKNYNLALIKSFGFMDKLFDNIDTLYITRLRLKKNTRILRLEKEVMYIVGNLGKLNKIYEGEVELGMLHARLHKKKNNKLKIQILEYDFIEDEEKFFSRYEGNFSICP